MDFNFDFSYLKNGSPIVTLSAFGIAFNKGAIDAIRRQMEVTPDLKVTLPNFADDELIKNALK